MDGLLNLATRVDTYIYAAMALIFLSGLLVCVKPVCRVNRALKRAEKKLTIRRSDDSFIYDHPDFLECRLINACWARFLVNMETMRRSNGSCDLNDYINAQSVIHGPGHSAYGEMLPGVLTTLGILGSFYGIVQGLSTLDLSTSTTMSQSIVVLIAGMRTAFNTSIVGALLALCFQLIRRLVITRAEHAMNSFVQSCQSQMSALLSPEAAMMQTLHAILVEVRKLGAGRKEV